MAYPDQDKMEPIAVVGMGCRFPGDATSPSALWQMLAQGENAWSEFPKDRVNIDSYFHPSGDRQGSICFKGAHFLKQNVAAFDTSFFSIPADEAKAVDPQQRMLLEVTVEALDNAGVDRNALRKSDTGVWVGSFVKDYEQIVLRDPDNSPVYGATGNGIAIMANRISYFLDINGPSMTIDTGCSASLVCVHNACQALRLGEIDCGLAGGAGLILTPNTMMPMTALNFLSPDGKCFTFDKRANGYGRGEGIGIVVLKRLSDAIRDNDNIRAVIRGSIVNQDGRTTGITLPSSEAQDRNIKTVYKRAGLDVHQTAYVECHGTGTQAGDHRELKGIYTSLSAQRPSDKPIYVGSIKTNVGHLEGCAGIAGLIKGVLTVENALIPKHLNFEEANPAIDFEGWKVKVPLENTPWPVEGLRRASVNCFGFGGTNAHVILDDAPHYLSARGLHAHHNSAIPNNDIRDPWIDFDHSANTILAIKAKKTEINRHAGGLTVPVPDTKSQVYVFSAHDPGALSRLLENHAAHLQKQIGKNASTTNIELSEDLAYTLACRRTKMQWRAAITALGVEELVEKLQQTTESDFVRASGEKAPNVAFVFGGQGAQWHAMGRELMSFDIFMHSLLAASAFLKEELNSPFHLLAELLKEEASSRVNEPEISQPATTAVQIALVDLLIHHYGVIPSSVVGHSSGEIAAAYAMGSLTREAAWALAYFRGLYANMSAKDGVDGQCGRMLVLGLSQREAEPYVDGVSRGRANIACVNSPRLVTLSGDSVAILEIHHALRSSRPDVLNRLLLVDVAYHSHHMDQCVPDYFTSICSIEPNYPATYVAPHPHADGRPVTAADVLQDSVDATPYAKGHSPIMYSSVTGERVRWNQLDAGYWITNMISPVLFSQAFTEMMNRSDGKRPDIIVEIGPHATLQGPIREILQSEPKQRTSPVYFSMLRRKESAIQTTLDTIGKLWTRGCPVEMPWVVSRNISFRRPKLMADLPNYPWNHGTLYWHESHLSRANRFQVYGRQDLVGRPTADSIPFQPRWRGFLRIGENPWIQHHQVQKTTIYPAAGMIAMAVEGAKQMAAGPYAGIEVSQFRIGKAMIVPPTEHGLEYALNFAKQENDIMPTLRRPTGRRASIALDSSLEPTTYSFSIYSKPLDGAWQTHGSGQVTVHYKTPTGTSGTDQASKEKALSIERYHEAYLEAKKVCDEPVIPRQLYETLDVIGMNYGPLFQNITSLQKRDDACTFVIRVPNTKSVMPAKFEFPHTIHPATLDSVFQTAFSMAGGDSMVPSFIGSLYVSANSKLSTEGADLVGYANAESTRSFREATVKFVLSHDSSNGTWSEPLVIVKDMTFTALGTNPDNSVGGFMPNHHNLCSELVWEESALDEESLEQKLPGGICLIMPDVGTPDLANLCNEISKKLVDCQVRSLSSIGDGHDLPPYCLSLLEAEDSFIWDWSETSFKAFRTLVLANSAKGLFWVTRGAQLEASQPKSALFQALARTIHSEDPKKHLVSYDTPAVAEIDIKGTADRITSAFFQSFARGKKTETEFVERNGHLAVSRLEPVPQLNKMIERGSAPPEPEPELLTQQEGRPLKLQIREIGKPGTLYWADDSKVSGDIPLPSKHVKIKVLSAGLSELDVDVVMGCGSDNLIGTDAYGVIESVAEDVQNLAVGDRVLAAVRGSFRTNVICHHALVRKLPGSIEASSFVVLPTTMATAHYALKITSRLKADQTILIHAASGSFGQAAIRLAKFLGARVFATVKTQKQRNLLRQHYRIPDECILDGNDASFAESISRLTHERGVDVIFDPVSDFPKLYQACVAASGYVVTLTKKDIGTVDFPTKTFTCAVIDLAHLIKTEPNRVGESLEFIFSHDLKMWMPSAPLKQCEYGELPAIISACAMANECGPTYCSVSDTNPVPVLPRHPHPARESLRSLDGTYLLAGQGGLSMHIAKLLESHGVRNIALLSRSGATKEASQKCITFLGNRGVNVKVIQVDICDRKALQEAIYAIQQTMPPICGLFQCAATIRDAVFENMTYEDWTIAARPKTIGSLNLFELLPKNMDFVIFLSSSAGVIGSRGQANYAAGNAFQDALARHINTTTSMRSVSIDLGPVLGAGMLAEDPRTLDMLKASGFFGIRLQDFERLIERAITGFTDGNKPIPTQVVIGVGTGGLIRQNKPADPYWTRTALFSHLNKVDMPEGAEALAADSAGAQSVKVMLAQCGDPDEARSIISTGLTHMLAQSMNMPANNVDDSKPPNAYGVDSLVAVGVRNWVFRECDVDVSVFEVLSDASIAELAARIVEKRLGGGGEHSQ